MIFIIMGFNKNYKVGDILVSDIFKRTSNVPYIFKITKVDPDFSYVHYKHKGKTHTLHMAWVRKANLIDILFGWFI